MLSKIQDFHYGSGDVGGASGTGIRIAYRGKAPGWSQGTELIARLRFPTPTKTTSDLPDSPGNLGIGAPPDPISIWKLWSSRVPTLQNPYRNRRPHSLQTAPR